MLNGSQTGAEKVPKTIKTERNGCQSEPRDVPKHPLGNRVEQIRKKGTNSPSPPPLFFFGQKSLNNQYNKNIEKHIAKKHDLYAKGIKLEQNSMHKLI